MTYIQMDIVSPIRMSLLLETKITYWFDIIDSFLFYLFKTETF